MRTICYQVWPLQADGTATSLRIDHFLVHRPPLLVHLRSPLLWTLHRGFHILCYPLDPLNLFTLYVAYSAATLDSAS